MCRRKLFYWSPNTDPQRLRILYRGNPYIGSSDWLFKKTFVHGHAMVIMRLHVYIKFFVPAFSFIFHWWYTLTEQIIADILWLLNSDCQQYVFHSAAPNSRFILSYHIYYLRSCAAYLRSCAA